MKDKFIGSFHGENSTFHLEIEKGFPILRIHGRDERLKGKMKFEDMCMLDNFIQQLESIKMNLFLKRRETLL